MTPEEEFDQLYAKEKGLASKPDKAMESYDALRNSYFEAKNKGGKAFFDFIQQHKEALEELFKDIPNEANLITLVPSIGDEATKADDASWVKEKNAKLRETTELQDAKIAAKEQSIKDARKRYRPDLAKMEADDAALTARIKEELKQKGYNPTDEDATAVKNELLKEQARVRRANEYEQKPAWQRIAFALTSPRTAESLSMGYRPTVKDNVLDLVELGSTFVPFGATAKFPGLFNKIGKAATKLDAMTKGVPGLNIAGDLAKGGGQIALPEFITSLGIRGTDAAMYDDGRERGEQSVADAIGGATTDAVAAALLGHAVGRIPPEKQKIIDAADEAIKKQSKMQPRMKYSQSKSSFIGGTGDRRVNDWRQYRTFRDAGDVQPHYTTWDELADAVGVKQVGLTVTKQQLKDFMDATGLDYIDAIDAMANGAVKIGTPEEIKFLKLLRNERDKFYLNNANKSLKKGALVGPAAAALMNRGRNTYGNMTEDRGYEE